MPMPLSGSPWAFHKAVLCWEVRLVCLQELLCVQVQTARMAQYRLSPDYTQYPLNLQMMIYPTTHLF